MTPAVTRRTTMVPVCFAPGLCYAAFDVRLRRGRTMFAMESARRSG